MHTVSQEPFINISTPKIDRVYSLQRTYMIFRTLGLGHLVVVDEHNRVVGMIERSDLLPSRIRTRIENLTRVSTAAEYNLVDLTTIELQQCGSGDDGEVETVDGAVNATNDSVM